MTQRGSQSFFRLLNRRYEKASIILTSGKGFADWERCSLITCWQQREITGSAAASAQPLNIKGGITSTEGKTQSQGADQKRNANQ
ncbi:ATP-binding protein [Salmonella enterica subsp. enterica]|nr:ATP-binding protein [Salmonella enterica subsp. enterica]